MFSNKTIFRWFLGLILIWIEIILPFSPPPLPQASLPFLSCYNNNRRLLEVILIWIEIIFLFLPLPKKHLLFFMPQKWIPKTFFPPQVLIIGGGIANFTNVAATFKGIVKALREFQTQLREGGISIYVRRAGPNYQEGLRWGSFLGKK